MTGCSADRFLADETHMAGSLFENFVAAEIVKQASWLEQRIELHHFRTAGGREADIVAEADDGSVVGIEVKLGAVPKKTDFSGLAHLRDRLGARFRAGALVNTGAPKHCRSGTGCGPCRSAGCGRGEAAAGAGTGAM